MTLQWDEMPHLYGGLLLARGQTGEYLSTYGFYPPVFDIVTMGYLQIFGVNVVAGRLVAFTFSLLAIGILFVFTSRIYGSKNALIASVLLGTMPGFFWLSRVSMLETMLIFFFTCVMFAFYFWISKNSNKPLLLSGLAMGIGILAKYQLVVAAIAMLFSVLFLCRERLKISLRKLPLIFVIVVLVVAPWFLMVYQSSGTTNFQSLAYVIQEGSPQRPEYSNRFFLPVFYLIEMTWPYNYAPTHPVALPIMILGLCGLALFAYRRKNPDIFLLTWFAVVYVFFTFVPHREWRYVDPLFPILAISAAGFIMFLYDKIRAWKPKPIGFRNRILKKLLATLFIVLIVLTIAYSSYNVYEMNFEGQFHVPIDEAAAYLASHLNQNQSAVVVCASNVLNQDMFRFYLPSHMSKYQVWQYPEQSIDAYTPDFNITQFISLCEQRDVKYAILFDYGPHMQFFNSTLDYSQVTTMMNYTGRFGVPTDMPFFGDFADNKGWRIFLVRFNQTQT
jgi:4-amino-4-deoxy-L-arabinose transferase-like glycosyltransferase